VAEPVTMADLRSCMVLLDGPTRGRYQGCSADAEEANAAGSRLRDPDRRGRRQIPPSVWDCGQPRLL